MLKNPSQKKLEKKKKLEEIRKDFGYKKTKNYADYIREKAELGDKECEKIIRLFNKKKGRVSKSNIF